MAEGDRKGFHEAAEELRKKFAEIDPQNSSLVDKLLGGQTELFKKLTELAPGQSEAIQSDMSFFAEAFQDIHRQIAGIDPERMAAGRERLRLQQEQERRRQREQLAKGMSREEVIEKIQAVLESSRRPAWKPIVERRENEVMASKFFGTPWLAAGESWPMCSCCKRPLFLFLQLNLSRLPEELGNRFGLGILQLFYCTSDAKCEASMNANQAFSEGKLIRIVQPEAGVDSSRITLPDGHFPALTISGWERVEDNPHPEELGIRFYCDPSEDTGSLDWPQMGIHSQNLGGNYNFDEFLANTITGDKLWGWPHWIQNEEYPNCPRCLGRMELVFQLNSEDHIPYMFGDCGCGHVTQCPDHKDILAFAWACG